jgi:DNA-binding beta-propeller fold protein YncE
MPNFTAALVVALLAGGIVDVPLPGNASRFDYQSFDPAAKRLYIAHMGDGELVVVDTAARTVVGQVPSLPTVTGVLVVPELHRVFASAAGGPHVVVVDTRSLKIVATVAAGEFPDGLAYSPETGKVFVSDERGGKETVIDAKSSKWLGRIDLGGEAGNTQYDAGSGKILVNVQSRNELVVIDPKSQKIVARHPLTGKSPHGLLVVPDERLAFAACEDDAKLLVVDLESFKVAQTLTTGERPDVLAFDPGLGKLYVASESGVLSIFHLRDRTLEKLDDVRVGAHTVAVNPETHELYLPLESVKGHPVLRILTP